MPQRPHHRPMRLPLHDLEQIVGAHDPFSASRLAHDTAAALLHRARSSEGEGTVERVLAYTREHGIDDVAELWAQSSPHSLPGALWRLYLVHGAAQHDAERSSYVFQRGAEVDRTISRAVAGAETPTGPDEIVRLTDDILRGAFHGDFALALDRAAAFCTIMSQGAASLAESVENVDEEEARRSTTQSARYLGFARDLRSCAGMWRDDALV